MNRIAVGRNRKTGVSLLSSSCAAKAFFTGGIRSLHFVRVIPVRFLARRSVQSAIWF
jgi:hypothetical protein